MTNVVLTGKDWYKIYVIESSSGHFKIGYSNNPLRRLKELKRTQGAFEYGLIYWLGFKEERHARTFEKSLHETFADRRVNGEWFTLFTDDLIYLGTLFAQFE